MQAQSLVLAWEHCQYACMKIAACKSLAYQLFIGAACCEMAHSEEGCERVP